MNEPNHAIKNFTNINNSLLSTSITKPYKSVYFNVYSDPVTITQRLTNRTESCPTEVLERIKSLQQNSQDQVYTKALKNKGLLTEIENHNNSWENPVLKMIQTICEKTA
ncbi:hypothetical protein CSB37_03230 [bacterium DOLZORAL124_38_8]|nr:MAG: hypothetical protein CSB37_03230 [bacterium DOLZORAL124_38_8]